jgi:dTDP-4-dehydrorhamnose 3,5-epimerase-like enzyme
MTKNNCKICNTSNLQEFLSFGKMPVSNAFLKEEDLDKPEFYYNMAVGFCEKCKMVQLMETVPYDKYIVPDSEGKTNYAFFTSTSEFMTKHFQDLARNIEKNFMTDNKRALDIGSNDGTLLKGYTHRDQVLGVEPSQNVAKVAQDQEIETTTEYFSEELAKKIVEQKGKFRAITSTNVTLNIIDIHDFVKGIHTLLDDKGIFVTEDPYLLSILENNSYDQIYDEHIWLFSLSSLENLYNMNGMEIFDAEKLWTHGGSMRVFSCKKGAYPKTERLNKYIKEEEAIQSLAPYKTFAENVEKNRQTYMDLIKDLKNQGKKIVGYAAASKGTIVQNYCDLNNKILDYITDSTPFKQGLYSPGKHIPVVEPEKFREDNADYAVLFAWNHAKEIMQKEKSFLKRGGKFIVHHPHPRILDPPLVESKSLKVHHEEGEGHLFEALRADDEIFEGKFGQNLISFTNKNVKKGLHMHEEHFEYTTCIKGNILYIAVKETDSTPIIEKHLIGEENMVMLKTPPGIWHGYIPLNNEPAIVQYTMDSPYDPDNIDQLTKPVDHFGDDIWNN